MGHRVILDTNVVLTGALLSQSVAGQLWKRNDKFTFVIPDFIISEAHKVVHKNASTQDHIIAAEVLITNYLNRLKAVTISELYPGGCVDGALYESAIKNNCKYICTYNIKHFPPAIVKAVSPLTVTKEIDDHQLRDFVPFFWAGEEGTVLFNGTLTHYSSLGELFCTANGTKVFIDDKGLMQVAGVSLKEHFICAALPKVPNQQLFLIFRYSKKSFEGRLLDHSKNKWIVLTYGQAEFILPIMPKLGTTDKFNGIIYDFSAIPRFIKNKPLSVIVQNGCLECVIGGEDIFKLLNNIKIEKITRDEWNVTF